METQERTHSTNGGDATKYFAVWIALLVLTATTFGVSRIDLGKLNLPISLLIASIKGALVALIFMHLWQHRGSVRLVLFVALCFVLLLTSFTIFDYATRFPSALPPGARRSALPATAETIDTPVPPSH